MNSGDILELTLEKGLGITYCKVVRSTDVLAEAPLNFLLYPYDLLVDNGLHDCSGLDGIDWITNPLIIKSEPKLTKKSPWRLLGHRELSSEEKIIPSYREGLHLRTTQCSVVVNFQNKRVWPVDISACEHLGEWIHFTDAGVVTALTFLWLRKLSKNIEDFYPDIRSASNSSQQGLFTHAHRMIFLKDVPVKDRFHIIDTKVPA